MKIRVANFNIDIVHINGDYFSDRYKAYRSEFEQADLTVRFSLCDRILKEGNHIANLADNTVLTESDGRLIETYYAYNKPYMSISRTFDYSTAEIKIVNAFSAEKIKALEYFHISRFFSRFLAKNGALGLHSSCVSLDGQGVCFTAPSGTGKSTHTGNWLKVFGNRAVIINDDKPAIIFKNNEVLVCGTPWSGKTTLNENMCVPLKAVVYLRRGEENTCALMDKNEALLRIIEQTLSLKWDEQTTDNLIPQIEKLLEKIPVYSLACNTDAASAVVACKTIFGGKYEN